MDSEIAHMVYILVLVPCLFQPPCTVGTRAEDCCLFLWPSSRLSRWYCCMSFFANERAYSCHSLRVDSELCPPPSAGDGTHHPSQRPPSCIDFFISAQHPALPWAAPAALRPERGKCKASPSSLQHWGGGHPSLGKGAQGSISSPAEFCMCLTKHRLGKSYICN